MEQLSELFVEAGTLMLAGMVFVFSFLGLLIVFITKILAPLGKKYPDAKPSVQPRRVGKKAKQPESGVSPSVVAAISTAVVRYRQQHQVKK